jgi:hypothetical protein
MISTRKSIASARAIVHPVDVVQRNAESVRDSGIVEIEGNEPVLGREHGAHPVLLERFAAPVRMRAVRVLDGAPVGSSIARRLQTRLRAARRSL